MPGVPCVSPYVARELARLYPDRWAYDDETCKLTARGPAAARPAAEKPEPAEPAPPRLPEPVC